jgi:hypothetical protein
VCGDQHQRCVAEDVLALLRCRPGGKESDPHALLTFWVVDWSGERSHQLRKMSSGWELKLFASHPLVDP